MSTLATSSSLGTAVLAHFDAQLASARRLLEVVLQQGAAIRRQDVEAVLARMGDLQAEMEVRGGLEQQRTALLQRAGADLGVPGHAVTLDALTGLMTAPEGAAAREHSAELRGLLSEVSREHTVNRALMRQELAFLDHLTRLLAGGADLGYRPPSEQGGEGLRAGAGGASSVHRVLDLQA